MKQMKRQRVYYKGTRFWVKYSIDGITHRRFLLLAETYEENMVFQVIEERGYDAGLIRGYIPKEFNDAMFVTYSHLNRMACKYIFPNISKLWILNCGHSERREVAENK